MMIITRRTSMPLSFYILVAVGAILIHFLLLLEPTESQRVPTFSPTTKQTNTLTQAIEANNLCAFKQASFSNWPGKCKVSGWNCNGNTALSIPCGPGAVPWSLNGRSITCGGSDASSAHMSELYISGCGLKGTISPQISSLTSLQILSLDSNVIMSSIPSQISSLSNLLYLSLHNNTLTGCIPNFISTLTKLTDLDLSMNRLECSAGQFLCIPSLAENAGALQIQENNFSCIHNCVVDKAYASDDEYSEAFFDFDTPIVDECYAPSHLPTAFPTANPSHSAKPSPQPSANPSPKPSPYPSASPSAQPTLSPSFSFKPSRRPSASPTTANPTAFPTARPSQPSNCKKGLYAVYNDRGVKCVPCSSGKYSNVSAAISESTCKWCGLGKYSPEPGQASCTSCPLGKYFDVVASKSFTNKRNSIYNYSSASLCADCPAGHYSDRVAQLSCKSCRPNTFSILGQEYCTTCPHGSISEEGSSFCVLESPHPLNISNVNGTTLKSPFFYLFGANKYLLKFDNRTQIRKGYDDLLVTTLNTQKLEILHRYTSADSILKPKPKSRSINSKKGFILQLVTDEPSIFSWGYRVEVTPVYPTPPAPVFDEELGIFIIEPVVNITIGVTFDIDGLLANDVLNNTELRSILLETFKLVINNPPRSQVKLVKAVPKVIVHVIQSASRRRRRSLRRWREEEVAVVVEEEEEEKEEQEQEVEKEEGGNGGHKKSEVDEAGDELRRQALGQNNAPVRRHSYDSRDGRHLVGPQEEKKVFSSSSSYYVFSGLYNNIIESNIFASQSVLTSQSTTLGFELILPVIESIVDSKGMAKSTGDLVKTSITNGFFESTFSSLASSSTDAFVRSYANNIDPLADSVVSILIVEPVPPPPPWRFSFIYLSILVIFVIPIAVYYYWFYFVNKGNKYRTWKEILFGEKRDPRIVPTSDNDTATKVKYKPEKRSDIHEYEWTAINCRAAHSSINGHAASAYDALLGCGERASVYRAELSLGAGKYGQEISVDVALKIFDQSSPDEYEDLREKAEKEAVIMTGIANRVMDTESISVVYGIACGELSPELSKLLRLPFGALRVGLIVRLEPGGDLKTILYPKAVVPSSDPTIELPAPDVIDKKTRGTTFVKPDKKPMKLENVTKFVQNKGTSADVALIERMLKDDTIRNVDVTDITWNGGTALMYQAEHGTKDAMEWLLTRQPPADYNAQDSVGKTALMYAVRDNDPGKIRLLLEYGADRDIFEASSERPIDHAKVANKAEYVTILMEYFPQKKDKKSIAVAKAEVETRLKEKPAPLEIPPLTLEYKLGAMKNIAQGLRAIHLANAIHGNLKPSNVLFTTRNARNEDPSLRLADFGLSEIHTSQAHLPYCAPELISYMMNRVSISQMSSSASDLDSVSAPNASIVMNAEIDEADDRSLNSQSANTAATANVKKSQTSSNSDVGGRKSNSFSPPSGGDGGGKVNRATDMYALGVISWEIMSGRRPYSYQFESDNFGHYSKFLVDSVLSDDENVNRPLLSDLPSDTPASIRAMIASCWNKDPSKRLTATECYAISLHAFYIASSYKHKRFDLFFSHAPGTDRIMLKYVSAVLTDLGYRVHYDELGPFSEENDVLEAIKNSTIVLVCANSTYQTREKCMFELQETSRLYPEKIVSLLTEGVSRQKFPDKKWAKSGLLVDQDVNRILKLSENQSSQQGLPSFCNISKVAEDSLWQTPDKITPALLGDLKKAVQELVDMLGQPLNSYEETKHEVEHQENSLREIAKRRKNFLEAASDGDIKKLLANMNIENINTCVDKGGYTAIMLAAKNGNIAIVEKLLEEGANIDHQNEYGQTILMFAAHRGHEAVVDLLISKGANITTTTMSGTTAESLADQRGHKNIAEKLRMAALPAVLADDRKDEEKGEGKGGGDGSLENYKALVIKT